MENKKISPEEHLYGWLATEGIIESRHCVLRSGRHSDTYIAKTKITLSPALYLTVSKMLTQKIVNVLEFNYDIITGPAVAGICFAAPVASNVGKPLIFPEKFFYAGTDYYEMTFRKEFREKLPDKKVVIIEDVITTGMSTSKTAKAIRSSGGIPVAVFCIWNTDPSAKGVKYKYTTFAPEVETITPLPLYNATIPIFSLISKEVSSWPAEECSCIDGEL